MSAPNPTPTPKPTPHTRSAYRAFRSIPTRWADNDMYGHVNNVVYYSWFDTAVNALLIERGALDIHGGPTIGFVVETQCNYFAPVAFPQTVEAGIRVAQAGRSSIRTTKSRCSPRVPTAPPHKGTSCMCTSTGRRSGQCRCPRRCSRWSIRCAPERQ